MVPRHGKNVIGLLQQVGADRLAADVRDIDTLFSQHLDSVRAGRLAMARTSDPTSASAQFFINVKDNAFLDPTVIPPGDPVPRFEYQGRVYENVPRAQLTGAPQLYGYTVFGKVVSGMDVVNKIKATPTGASGPFPSDVPRTPVVITSAAIVK